MKISQRVLKLLRGHKIMTDGHTDGQTDRRTDGQGDYYRALPTSSGGALITAGSCDVSFTLQVNYVHSVPVKNTG